MVGLLYLNVIKIRLKETFEFGRIKFMHMIGVGGCFREFVGRGQNEFSSRFEYTLGFRYHFFGMFHMLYDFATYHLVKTTIGERELVRGPNNKATVQTLP